jgi:hypothetical protein
MTTIVNGEHVITDEELDAWATGLHQGHANSVEYFRPLTPTQRYAAYWEANTRMNFIGGNFSGNAYYACQDVAAGRTPYGDQAEQYRQIENAKTSAQRTADYNAAVHYADAHGWQ